MRRVLCAAALLALAPAFAAAHPASHHAAAHSRIDERIQQQQAKVHGLHVQLNAKKAQLEDAKGKVQSLSAQLAQTNHNIALVDGHLGDLQGRVKSTQRKLAWNQVQLGAARATLKRHQDALDRRLVDAYEHGDLGYVDVLLRARSFADFVERWNDIRYLIKANQSTIRDRKSDERRVAAVQGALLGAQSELLDEQAQVQQQQRALDALAAERKNLLDVADQQRANVQTQVAQMEEMSEEEEAALGALIRQKQAEAEAEREARRRAAQLAGEALPSEPSAPGTLMWPASGPITDPYGMRMHPVFHRMILHAGIDIGIPTGTTVAAAAAGRIIVAGWGGNCGNMIAIDHAGGLSTVYCHLSQVFVGVGQDVQRGQAIAASGATGDATGPHLHFEVRENGHPVDPMSFLH